MKQLMEYVRKKGRQRTKVGVLVAKKVKTSKGKKKILVGWSRCKLTGDHPDTFSREKGLEIAEGRITSRLEDKKVKTKVPPSIRDQVKAFVKRCKNFFDTKEVKVV